MPDEPVPEPDVRGQAPLGSFRWRGFDLPLFDHPYNATLRNERAVEIPIAMDFLARGAGRVLEVGNVLSHYFTQAELPPRVIVDRYEPGYSRSGPQTTLRAIDVFDIDGQFDCILSISTVEHVRLDPPESPNNYGAVAALAYLRGLLAPGGSMLFTAGAGQNPTLDRFLLGGMSLGEPFGAALGLELTTLVREGWPHQPPVWVERHAGEGDRTVEAGHGARTVWIGEVTP